MSRALPIFIASVRRTCIIIIAVIIALVLGLRLMEELYDPSMEEIKSHFAVLEVSETATDAEIRKAYRKLQLK